MEHHVHVWRGLFKPEDTLHNLRESQSIHGYRLRLLILLFCSSIIFGLVFYICAAEWLQMPEVVKLKLTAEQEFSAAILIGIGGAIVGLIIPFLIIGSMTLSFWGFFRDIGYRKLFILHTYLFVIILVAIAAHIPYMWAFGSTEILSPFGIGPWVKAVTNNVFLTTLAGWITLFSLWHLYTTVKLLMETSLKPKRYIYTVAIGLHVTFILILAVINMMYHLQLNG
ncbi:hypothetical protein [Pseudalkalibacillus sp. SCS-8]|uniref:hypothetical protein n=1 Tax=Pseudalkalibacillus nanhaiensis TaxID=3115291 RepID=UPI0032DB1429